MSVAAPSRTARWFLDNRVELVAGELGRFSLLEIAAHPGDAVPLHVHHDEDEVFTVLEGELTLVVDGVPTVVEAGRSVSAPRGVPHAYLVTSHEPARWLVLTSPGVFGDFVEALSRPAGEGLPEPAGPPTPEQAGQLAEAALAFGIEILGPPPFPA